MGSGPSSVPDRVLEALAQPTIGLLDPEFLAIADRTNERLRSVFGTENPATFPVSGTGSAGMETMLVNFLEPGDRLVVGVCGLFGERISDAASRLGAEVVRVEAEWGTPIDPERLVEAVARRRRRARRRPRRDLDRSRAAARRARGCSPASTTRC